MKSPLGRFDEPLLVPHYQDKLQKLLLSEKPKTVVETGFLHGYGSEWILQALDKNEHGHLYSIDPNPYPSPYLRSEIELVHPRFTLIEKKSQDALEDLFKEVGPFDVFVHDSDHEAECQRFEYEAAWRMVRPGGIIASDDVTWGTHRTWETFCQEKGVCPTIIGNAAWFRRP